MASRYFFPFFFTCADFRVSVLRVHEKLFQKGWVVGSFRLLWSITLWHTVQSHFGRSLIPAQVFFSVVADVHPSVRDKVATRHDARSRKFRGYFLVTLDVLTSDRSFPWFYVISIGAQIELLLRAYLSFWTNSTHRAFVFVFFKSRILQTILHFGRQIIWSHIWFIRQREKQFARH